MPSRRRDFTEGATKKFIRFGVRVRNTSGATLEMGMVAIRLEQRLT